jgi:hypothetical protein
MVPTENNLHFSNQKEFVSPVTQIFEPRHVLKNLAQKWKFKVRFNGINKRCDC